MVPVVPTGSAAAAAAAPVAVSADGMGLEAEVASGGGVDVLLGLVPRSVLKALDVLAFKSDPSGPRLSVGSRTVSPGSAGGDLPSRSATGVG